MNELRVYFHGFDAAEPVLAGRLGYGRGDAYTHVELDPGFLRRGISLSPLRLKFEAGLQAAPPDPFEGLHGLFADSLPDGWGRLLMDRLFRQRGIEPHAVSPLDRLAMVGSRTMGALSYAPDTGASGSGKPALLDLPVIGIEATRQYRGEVGQVLEEFVRHASPSGGARPKFLIGLSDSDDSVIAGAEDLPEGYSHWLAKFPTGDAPHARSAGAIEYLFSEMARTAGIRMMETRLVPGRGEGNAYFLTRRFDRRPGNRRRHVHSVAGLAHANYRLPDFDYLDLFKLSDLLTRSHAEKTELFRRMAFNIVSGNRDDHTKNFAFRMSPDGEWANTPAYDLTYNPGIRGHHSMTVQGKGKDFSRNDLLDLARTASIPRAKALRAVEEVCDAASLWGREARHYPIPNEQVDEIRKHMDRQGTLLLPARAFAHSRRPEIKAPGPGA